MVLHGFKGDPDLGGNLLVRFPGDEQLKDFTLPRGDRAKAIGGLREREITLASIAGDPKRLTNGREQKLRIYRFLQEILHAMLHGSHGGGNIRFSGEDNHGQVFAGVAERNQPAHTVTGKLGDQTGDLRILVLIEELVLRAKCESLQPGMVEEELGRTPGY